MTHRLAAALVIVAVLAGFQGADRIPHEWPGESVTAQTEGDIALLLDDPTPDQMFRLLWFMQLDSMDRAATLMEDPAIETDEHLQAQLAAETGVWDAVYRAAILMPPLVNPQLNPVEGDSTEALRLATIAGAAVRDYLVTGDQASIDQVATTLSL